MSQIAERTADLICKYLLDDLTPNETTELNHWIGLSSDNKSLFEKLTDLDLLSEKMKGFLAINDTLSLQPERVLHKKVS